MSRALILETTGGIEPMSTPEMHFQQYLSMRTGRSEQQLKSDMMTVQEILEVIEHVEPEAGIPLLMWLKALTEIYGQKDQSFIDLPHWELRDDT